MVEDIVGKLKRELGSSFITARDFARDYGLTDLDALDLLNSGAGLGVFIITLEGKTGGTTDPSKEFALKQHISDEAEEEFNKIISQNFGGLNNKGIILSAEEGKLRDEVLMELSLRQRSEASGLMVNHIKAKEDIYTIREDKNEEVWIYKDGIYIPQGKTYIKEICSKILGQAYTSHFTNLIIEKIVTSSYIEQKDFFENKYIYQIPVENGILNIKTRKLSNFTPKKIFFNKLPVLFDPTKKCPKITKHFQDVLACEDDIKVMFELIGYCLLKDSKFEKAFMFNGWGRNGKGKTLELIKKFLGVESCSALGLTQLNEESFDLSELQGKLSNLAGDLSYHALKKTGMLKMLISRDPISAKRKFLNTLYFVSYAKMIFACNELPKIYDMTDGFWTKMVLLNFPYKFITQKEMDKLPEKDKADKKIINVNQLQDISDPSEMSGLLNEALMSLGNLEEQGNFSYSKGTEEVKDLWIRRSDSFMAFCLDKLEEEPDGRISKTELRKAYRKYCKEYKGKGIRRAGDVSIKSTLERLFGVDDSQDFGTKERYWCGIKFKEEKINPEVLKIEC